MGTVDTDERLMDAVRGGDAARLGALFERHHVALFEFLYRTTGDRAGAEDLVQDVFVRILKYRHTYHEGSPFSTWMYRIARNARADYLRRRNGAVAIRAADGREWAEFDPPSQAPGPTERAEWGGQAALLRRALLQLPDDKRELIVLARYQQMPYEHIAHVLGVEVGTVKVRVHRALKHLREVFDRLATRRLSCDVKTPLSTSRRS